MQEKSAHTAPHHAHFMASAQHNNDDNTFTLVASNGKEKQMWVHLFMHTRKTNRKHF